MSWRTIVISKRCKLDLKMGYMVVRDDEVKRIFLDEIYLLIIENSAVSLTGCLLEALCEKKIQVIFCDSKRNPMAELSPYYGCHNSSSKIRQQIIWNGDFQKTVWTRIVYEKIKNQAEFLYETGKSAEGSLLSSYLEQIEFNDETNREGHAAKVYFNALFGMDFSRNKECNINKALNYGYSILLSAFNREICSCGYLTQLGINHCNIYNKYNLSCDLMEPFRVLIDRQVYELELSDFGRSEKYKILEFLSMQVRIDGSRQSVSNAIKIYTNSIFDALNEENTDKMRLIEI